MLPINHSLHKLHGPQNKVFIRFSMLSNGSLSSMLQFPLQELCNLYPFRGCATFYSVEGCSSFLDL